MTGIRPLKLLFISTSVAPLGSGTGGGVELVLYNLSEEMTRRGHTVDVIAPEGSVLGRSTVIQMSGNLQPKAQFLSRKELPASPDNSVLSNMCNYAHKNQHRFDLIVNFSYDWLPLYLTSEFDTPLAHLISMSSLNDAIDFEIKNLMKKFRDRVACHSNTQAETFPMHESIVVLGSGIDLSKYTYCETPDDYIAWAGRISREKGLEDTINAVEKAGHKLKIVGKIDDQEYWNFLTAKFDTTIFNYEGFLSTFDMQKILQKSKALMMTHKVVEAFGMVAIEALACGVPVISYNIGGPSEIIKHGINGFLVKPNDIDKLADAIFQTDKIDRKTCRKNAEENYSLHSWGNRFENWLLSLLRDSPTLP